MLCVGGDMTFRIKHAWYLALVVTAPWAVLNIWLGA
tara:strand:- start:15 stop:122 length:108 start_codon:yes stop_codon:yes gene_type:complete